MHRNGVYWPYGAIIERFFYVESGETIDTVRTLEKSHAQSIWFPTVLKFLQRLGIIKS